MRGPLALFASTAPAAGRDFYIRNGGIDSATGLSDAQAWATVAKVNGRTKLPGDRFHFDGVSVWRETIIVDADGLSPISPITYDSYGLGLATFDGTDVITGWTSEVVGSFTAYWKGSFASDPQQVFQNNARYNRAASKAALVVGSYFWDSGTSRVYVRTTGNNAPSGYTMEIPKRDYGIQCAAQSHIRLTNLRVTRTADNGIYISGGTYTDVVISGCVSDYTGKDGIQYTSSVSGSWNRVTGCTVSYNLKNGIAFGGSTNYSRADHNTVHHASQDPANNYTGSFKASISPANHDNEWDFNLAYTGGYHWYTGAANSSAQVGDGYWLDTCGPGWKIHDNVEYGSQRSTLHCENTEASTWYRNLGHSRPSGFAGIYCSVTIGTGIRSLNNRFYHNTFFNPGTYGIRIIGYSAASFVRGGTTFSAPWVTGNVFENNLVIGAATEALSAQWGAENDGSFGSGNLYLNNAFGVQRTKFIKWGGSPSPVWFNTYAAWVTAAGSGVAGGSVTTNPTFVDSANGNFALASGSAGLDAGLVIAEINDGQNLSPRYAGSAPDLGAIELRTQTLSAALSTATVPAGTAGLQTVVIVQARDTTGAVMNAGGATLAGVVTGTNAGATVGITDLGTGRYRATYTPASAGSDTLALTLNTVAIGGSPYTSAVAAPPSVLSPANSTATVPSGLQGSTTTITVQARDTTGANITSGGATLAGVVSGANAGATVNVSDPADGTYLLTYLAAVTGADAIAITMNGTAIGGSPYASTVFDEAASAALSSASVPGGRVGLLTSIVLQTRSSTGANLTTGDRLVQGTVTGANPGPCAVTDNDDGTYLLTYTPSATGSDSVAITLDSVAVGGSPYASTVLAGPAVAATSTAAVPAAGAGGVRAIIVQLKDASGNNLTVSGGGTVSVTITGANPRAATAATDNGNGTYTITDTPTLAGTDTVGITYGGVAISGSPYSSTVIAGAPVAANAVVTVPGGVAGAATTVSVTLRDAYNNPILGPGSTLTMVISGANTAGPLTVSYQSGGLYSRTYTPTLAGNDAVAINFSGGGAAIGSSPYTSTVVAGAVSAAGSTATVPSGVPAGVVRVITVQARDVYGNPRSTGGSTVVVTVTGTNPAGAVTAVDNGNGTYTTSHIPTLAGGDLVAIALGGVALGASPYTSVVTAAGVAQVASFRRCRGAQRVALGVL